jgi:UDP-N-acetyl-D-glucosamine dehydrogenase
MSKGGQMSSLIEKINSKRARIGIIGIGYVGLPLAVEFAKSGYNVVGIDLNQEKVRRINRGENYIKDIPDSELRGLVEDKRLSATCDFSVLKDIDAISICVPTPLNKTKDPDLSCILDSTKEIKRYLHKDQLIILESTTYPGTTRELILPMLEDTGLKVGTDFFLTFSPERIDPGNKIFNTRNTPKIIGGITEACKRHALALYGYIIDKVIPVSSTESAEIVKLLENTFRSINIGLVNEVAIMCNKLGIDVWEVIEAASSKPYGFMPFYPGPGLGGHCIPIDPHYLSWKLKTLNYRARFIELAGEINSGMPHYVVDKMVDALNRQKKCLNGSRILILGVAYKKDIDDPRDSPALDIIKILQEKGAEVSYNDPYIPSLDDNFKGMRSIDINKGLLSGMDCVVIVTDHSTYDWEMIAKNSKLVVDTRNATSKIQKNHTNIVKL